MRKLTDPILSDFKKYFTWSDEDAERHRRELINVINQATHFKSE